MPVICVSVGTKQALVGGVVLARPLTCVAAHTRCLVREPRELTRSSAT